MSLERSEFNGSTYAVARIHGVQQLGPRDARGDGRIELALQVWDRLDPQSDVDLDFEILVVPNATLTRYGSEEQYQEALVMRSAGSYANTFGWSLEQFDSSLDDIPSLNYQVTREGLVGQVGVSVSYETLREAAEQGYKAAFKAHTLEPTRETYYDLMAYNYPVFSVIVRVDPEDAVTEGVQAPHNGYEFNNISNVVDVNFDARSFFSQWQYEARQELIADSEAEEAAQREAEEAAQREAEEAAQREAEEAAQREAEEAAQREAEEAAQREAEEAARREAEEAADPDDETTGDGETPEGTDLDIPGLEIAATYSGSITFMGESAGYRNTLGMYRIDEDGSIQDVEIIFENASAYRSGGNLHVGQSSVDVTFEAGEKIGFFILPNGWNGSNRGDIEAGDTDIRYEFRDAEGTAVDVTHTDMTYLWAIHADGSESKLHTSAKGVSWHSIASEENGFALNGDGLAHTVFQMTKSEDGRIVLDMGFEDLWAGGDRDYDDVMFRVDIGGDNVESAISSLDLPPLPSDLTITALRAEETTLDDGEDLFVSVDVANIGDGAAEMGTTTYFWSETDTFDAETAVELDVDNHGSLEAGETEADEEERIQYSALEGLGSGYLFAMIDAGDLYDESDETNNLSGPIEITLTAEVEEVPELAPADLTITALQARNTDLDVGDDLMLNASVANLGETDVFNASTTYYWSATETLDLETAVAVGTDGHGSLRGGESDGKETLRIRYEALQELGDGFIFGVIDADNAVAESDEANNVSDAIEISVAFSAPAPVGQADLTINAMAVRDTTLEEDQDLQVRLEVENIGDASAVAVRTTYFWSETDTFDAETAVRLGDDNHGRLREGQVKSDEYQSLDYDDLAELGDGYLFAMIDAGQAVSESDETNNLSGPVAITVEAPSDADLVIEDISVSDRRLAEGQDTFVYLDVSNTGDENTDSVRTTLYWNPNAVFDADTAVELAQDHHGELKAGETETDERTRLRYEDLEELGDGYLFGLIDAGNTTPEEGEGNNLSDGVYVTIL